MRLWLYLDVNATQKAAALCCYLSLLLRVATGRSVFTRHQIASTNVLTELAAAAGNSSKEHGIPVVT